MNSFGNTFKSYQLDTKGAALAQKTPTDTIVYGYDSTWKDKLVSYDGQSITYDVTANQWKPDDWAGKPTEILRILLR